MHPRWIGKMGVKAAWREVVGLLQHRVLANEVGKTTSERELKNGVI